MEAEGEHALSGGAKMGQEVHGEDSAVRAKLGEHGAGQAEGCEVGHAVRVLGDDRVGVALPHQKGDLGVSLIRRDDEGHALAAERDKEVSHHAGRHADAALELLARLLDELVARRLVRGRVCLLEQAAGALACLLAAFAPLLHRRVLQHRPQAVKHHNRLNLWPQARGSAGKSGLGRNAALGAHLVNAKQPDSLQAVSDMQRGRPPRLKL